MPLDLIEKNARINAEKVQYGELKTIEVGYINGVSFQIFSTAFSELKFGGYFSSTLSSGPNMF